MLIKVVLIMVIILLKEDQLCFSQSNTPKLVNIYQKRSLDSAYLISDVQFEEVGMFFASCDQKKISYSARGLKEFTSNYVGSDTLLLAEGILAHEYAHLKQCEKNPDIFRSTYISKKELHADFLAGHYLSRRYIKSFMTDTSQMTIFNQICLFFKHENKNLNIIIAMLINSDYEFDYGTFGFDNETSKIMRFTALWRGLSNSGINDFNEAYRFGLEFTDRLISNQNSIKTFKVFKVIGIEIITKILKGELNYQNTIREISAKINQNNNGLTRGEKSSYNLALNIMRRLNCR